MQTKSSVFGFLIIISMLGIMLFTIGEAFYIMKKRTVITGHVDRVTPIFSGNKVSKSMGIPSHMTQENLISVSDGKTRTIFRSDDSKWFTVDKAPNECVQVEVFPYPPWDFTKNGTYGRLLSIDTCQKTGPPPKALIFHPLIVEKGGAFPFIIHECFAYTPKLLTYLEDNSYIRGLMV